MAAPLLSPSSYEYDYKQTAQYITHETLCTLCSPVDALMASSATVSASVRVRPSFSYSGTRGSDAPSPALLSESIQEAI